MTALPIPGGIIYRQRFLFFDPPLDAVGDFKPEVCETRDRDFPALHGLIEVVRPEANFPAFPDKLVVQGKSNSDGPSPLLFPVHVMALFHPA